MSNRSLLQQQQPIIYRTLYHALKNQQLSHCYLFSGAKETSMKECAILLAQSLLCENPIDYFGCENCSSCSRVLENRYSDFIYVEGDKNIKAEQIDEIRQRFEKTALEQKGQKVFIINNCENLTGKAANSLLKFIEEPSQSTTGIFITTSIERVLPTIVSRCQTLNFKPIKKAAFYQKAKQLQFSELDSHFLSELVHNLQEVETLSKNKNYQQAFQIFAEFHHLLFTDQGFAIHYLQKNLAKLNKKDTADSKNDSDSNKLNIRTTFSLFLDFCLIFINDYLQQYQSEDLTYQNLLQLARQTDFDDRLYLTIVNETKDILNKPVNIPLLADQFLYQLTEVLHGKQ